MQQQLHLKEIPTKIVQSKSIFDWIKEGFVEEDYVLLQVTKGYVEDIISTLKDSQKVIKNTLEGKDPNPFAALKRANLNLEFAKANINQLIEKINEILGEA